MDSVSELARLTSEINSFKDERRYDECIIKMSTYEEHPSVPIRNVALMAKASCALELGDFESAGVSLERVSQDSLGNSEAIYFRLLLINVLQDAGDYVKAMQLIDLALSNKVLYGEEYKDALYETLARKAFLLAGRNEFAPALEYLNQSLAVIDTDYLRENVMLYKGFCLQGIGRLDEAEHLLKTALPNSKHLYADFLYRLGAVYLQKEDFGRALEAFQQAELNVTNGSVELSDILLAISTVYGDLGQVENKVLYEKKYARALISQ